MAEVRFGGVTKRSGGVGAVHELDLVAADGKFLVLLGPSGYGITTGDAAGQVNSTIATDNQRLGVS